MNNEQLVGKAISFSESAMVQGIINRTIIVEWGTIKRIVAKGIVEVLLAVTDRPENTSVITCVLISPCSASFAIDIIPVVGDKVLVLSPRKFDVNMFDVSDNTEVIERANFTGYNKLSCVAILYNQFRPATYKSSISMNNGIITLNNSDKKQSITIDLTQNNKIVLSDSNGMKIESTSSSTTINGKLEIKV